MAEPIDEYFTRAVSALTASHADADVVLRGVSPQTCLDVFDEQLGSRHLDLAARWLLNLAYQTLGEHPDAVPEAWLIPQERFASAHDVGRYRDVAPALGGRIG